MRQKMISVFLIAAFSFWGVSCSGNQENPVAISVKQTLPITLEFVYLNPEGYPIILESGQVTIFKNDKKLLEAPIQTIDEVTNSIQLTPLNQPPPYTYRLENAKIKGLLSERFAPFDGGLNLGNPVLLPSGAISRDDNGLKNPVLLPSGAYDDPNSPSYTPASPSSPEPPFAPPFAPPSEEEALAAPGQDQAQETSVFKAGASFDVRGQIEVDLQKTGRYSLPEQEITAEQIGR